MELKHKFISRLLYDMRTKAGRKWKKEFIAAGFEWPIKIGQGTYYFNALHYRIVAIFYNSF